MTARCWRSAPRCADCPVVLAARRRRFVGAVGSPEALVSEVLAGASGRDVPAAVQEALDELAAARAAADTRRFCRSP